MKKLIAGILIVVLLFGAIACGAAEEAPTHWVDEDEVQGIEGRRRGSGE